MKTLIFPFILFTLFKVNAASNYYSRQAGVFTLNNTWSNSSHTGSSAASAPCACACSIAGSSNLYISHSITINCDLTFSGNPTIVIESGGSLNVTGNASITGSATFTVNAGAVVNVTGNFNINGGGGSVTINGTINVTGNITVNGGFPFCGNGFVNLGGAVTGTGSPCSSLTVLPVTWLNVETKYENEKVKIQWSTATEINNAYFTVEKSKTGLEYEEVCSADGAGNSTIHHTYSCIDNSPTEGINYYRVKQTDFDGHSEYSKIVALYISYNNHAITIYPSIVRNNYLNICFTGCSNESAEAFLTDGKGMLLNKKDYEILSNHEEHVYILPEGLQQDTYFMRVTCGRYINIQKIIFSQ